MGWMERRTVIAFYFERQFVGIHGFKYVEKNERRNEKTNIREFCGQVWFTVLQKVLNFLTYYENSLQNFPFRKPPHV